MKSTRRLAIVAALAAAGVWSVASAQGSSDLSGTSNYPQPEDTNKGSMGNKGNTGDMGQPSSGEGTMGEQAKAGEAAGQPELNGVVKGVDKTKRWITVQLSVPQDATIMRNGKAVGLDSIKAGDDVRASFDPNTQSISTIHIESKEMKHKK